MEADLPELRKQAEMGLTGTAAPHILEERIKDVKAGFEDALRKIRNLGEV